jgi:hypothetical protein
MATSPALSATHPKSKIFMHAHKPTENSQYFSSELLKLVGFAGFVLIFDWEGGG